MPTLVETAYAKINLALHVRRRRADGYHDLETLFAFVDGGDRLTASEGDDLTLTVSGPFGVDLESDGNNLVIRAANVLRQHFGVRCGAKLTLEKNLPVASGIGGGSADAAATARLLNKLWRLEASDADLAHMLEPLGADVPACVASATAIGRGTGTDLAPVDGDELTGMPVLLVNPMKPVPTRAVFSRWNGADRGPLGTDNVTSMMLESRNDLEPMASSICPEIGDILGMLRSTDPLAAGMSGSGATCFALYRNVDARDGAEAGMAAQWWTFTGKLR
jgi:4-diphosphocytidyl-2-C-methyl-D-erythritol kinase